MSISYVRTPYPMTKRHSVTLNDESFTALCRRGRFGESYSELILRLMQMVEKAAIEGEA